MGSEVTRVGEVRILYKRKHEIWMGKVAHANMKLNGQKYEIMKSLC